MTTATPAPLTSFPIYNAIRGCRACRLRRGCIAPVPGIGPIPCPIMVVGESPGAREDETGIPFTGQTGRLLDHLLNMAGLDRSGVYLTNIVKCTTATEVPPHLVAGCASEWLDGLEVQMVRPQTIIAMGQAAIRHFLGDSSVTVEQVHGIPQWVDGPQGPRSLMIFPTYNPAAGLRTTKQLRPIWEDWQVLGRIIEGQDPMDFVPLDQYPTPQYVRIENERDAREILHLPEYALDTETIPVDFGAGGRSLIGASATGIGTDPGGRPHRLWSVQVSNRAGTAYFIPAELIPDTDTAIPKTSTVYVHNYLYDRQFIRIPTYIDTMVAAYQLGLPQGLKQLAFRLAGMEMHGYEEYVFGGDTGTRMARDYLMEVSARSQEWPVPERLPDDKWSDRMGTVTRVYRNPQAIARKAQKALSDHSKDSVVNLVKRWRQIDARERRPVESVLGPMPEPSLADIDPDDALYYASRDADATWRIQKPLIKAIQESGLARVFYGVDLPTLDQFAEMMDNGISLDTEHLEGLSAEYLVKLKYQAAVCSVKGGYPFNPNSPDQVAALLYDGLGFPITGRTDTGKPSTDDRELQKVDHEVVPAILEYRKTLKNKTTYTDKLPLQVHPVTRRVHTTLRATRTETGRISSSDPNLQNIPIRSAEGKRIRQAFKAPPGYVFVALDYSQIEMRVMAHYTHAAALMEAFLTGKDVHRMTAAQMFRLDYISVTSPQRRIAKSINFGIIYGITASGLYEFLIEQEVEGWTLQDCERLLVEYNAATPEIAEYQERQSMLGRQFGYVEDLLGRRRYTPELICPIARVRNEGQRQAGNMPIQATAQEVIKMAGNRLRQEREAGRAPVDFKLLLQVHDDLMAEVREEDAYLYARWAKDVMEGVMELDVPIIADVKIGKNWGDMEEINLDEYDDHGNPLAAAAEEPHPWEALVPDGTYA